MDCINSWKPKTSYIHHCCTTIAGDENNVYKNNYNLPFTLLTAHEWMAGKYKDIEGLVDTLPFSFMIPFDYSPQLPGDLEAKTSASASSSRKRGWVTPRQMSQQWHLHSLPLTESHSAKWVIRHWSWLIWLQAPQNIWRMHFRY